MSSNPVNVPSSPPKAFSQFNRNPALYKSPTDAMVSPCTKQLASKSGLTKRAVLAAGRKNLNAEFKSVEKENM